MKGKRKYYIAYGSKPPMQQMTRRCHTAQIEGTGVIKDYQLLFKGSGSGAYLTIEKKKGATVPVGIWTVTECDEKFLDRYEGYPTFYYKKNMPVKVKSVKTGRTEVLDCFVYIMHEERKRAYPALEYVTTCLKGYDDFGFDEQYLVEALEQPLDE